MTRHITTRAPRGRSISWGKSAPRTEGDSMTYRLFRRDLKEIVHMAIVLVPAYTDRDEIAYRLKRARKNLREKVALADAAIVEAL